MPSGCDLAEIADDLASIGEAIQRLYADCRRRFAPAVPHPAVVKAEIAKFLAEVNVGLPAHTQFEIVPLSRREFRVDLVLR